MSNVQSLRWLYSLDEQELVRQADVNSQPSVTTSDLVADVNNDDKISSDVDQSATVTRSGTLYFTVIVVVVVVLLLLLSLLSSLFLSSLLLSLLLAA